MPAIRTREQSQGATGPASSACFSPLGVDLAVAADTPAALAAVALACRGWEGASELGARPLHLTLHADAALRGTGPPRIQVDGMRLRIDGDGVVASADAIAGNASCRLSQDYLRDGPRLREEILDTLILFLVARSGRVPIHAAAFLAGDTAILLAGPAGAGKSCLALAAHRAGFPVLSDDTVFVQLAPALAVWGAPRPIHLFPADAPARTGQPRLRNGKLKIAVRVQSVAAGPARRAVLCVLGTGQSVALRRLPQPQALDSLAELEPGFDLLGEPIAAALTALTRRGAWHLTRARDPDAAIALLRNALPWLEGTAVP